MKKLLSIALLAFSSLAYAQTGCNSSDLSGISVLNCSGYIQGNLLSGSPTDLSSIQSIFTGLGYTSSTSSWTEKLSNLNGTSTIDFNTPLNGVSIIGIHKGAAGDVQSTAFYIVNAGTNLDSFKYNLAGSSNAAIYSVSAISPIPEPGTSTMLASGLCVALWMAKRNQRKNK